MTNIEFYVLDGEADEDRIAMVCRLTEKAVAAAKTVFIHTDCPHLAESIDSALWHLSQESFLPHVTLDEANNSVTESSSCEEPVVIGVADQIPDKQRSVLINLANEVPVFFSGFERTVEVITGQNDVRASGRTRYAFYRRRGYPLRHHNLG